VIHVRFVQYTTVAALYSRTMKMLMLLAIGLMASENNHDIGQLSWMSGCWEGQIGPVRIEEQWNKPAGGTMLGLSRTLKDGKTVFSEFMHINQEQARIVYTARIGTKAAATPFELISMSADEVVFENPTHPFPQRIRYRREPNGGLFARIEGLDKGKERHEDFPMQRC
jgi:hypothetical protein